MWAGTCVVPAHISSSGCNKMDINNIFNCEFTRLSDLLVPLDVLAAQVGIIEGYPDYTVSAHGRKDGHTIDKTADTMCVPYPYTVPVDKTCAMHCKHHHISTLDEKIHDLWTQEIAWRTKILYNHAIDRAVMESIDADPNACVIVHLMSGYLVALDYEHLSDFIILNVPNSFPMLAKLIYQYNVRCVEGNTSIAVKEFTKGYTQIISDPRKHKLYCPVYTAHGDDDIVPPDKLINGSIDGYNMLDHQRSILISDAIIAGIQNHRRIILTV